MTVRKDALGIALDRPLAAGERAVVERASTRPARAAQSLGSWILPGTGRTKTDRLKPNNRTAISGQMLSANRVERLAALLRDRTAPTADRDDAAIDLGDYDDPQAEAALAEVGSDATDQQVVIASCGEFLAAIWVRTGHFDPVRPRRLAPAARAEAEAVLRAHRPEWLAASPTNDSRAIS